MLTRLGNSVLILGMGMLTACEQLNNNSETVEANGTTAAQAVERKMPERKEFTYTAVKGKDSSIKKLSGAQLEGVLFLNRCDKDHLVKKDTVIVPNEFADDMLQYSPFPFHVTALKEIKKVVFFSYHAQVFAAYENGYLVYSGPTNMGSKKHQTPTGLYFTNWKAEETQSTFDDEWILKWNFNIENKEGIGWHQYAMPGYPASHSCLRMLEADAKKMYEWAEQWELQGTDNVRAKGTPVIVFGAYPFGSPRPWFALLQDPKALDISEDELMQEVQPHLQKILDAQATRDKVVGTGK